MTLVAPTLLRPMLQRMGVLDVPNERSSHARPTLRGGGLALLLGWIAGLLVSLLGIRGASVWILVIITSAAVALALIGLADDLRHLRAVVRLGCQLVIGLVVAAALCHQYEASYWWVLPIAVVLSWYVNVTNFMDGINGISGSHGLVVGGAFAAIGVLTQLDWLTISALVLAVISTAFLPWNFIPPGMFLGDVGSYLLGGVIVTIAVAAGLSGINVIVIVGPLSIYLADTLVTLVRRSIRGEPLMQAHRTHAYQRLTDTGLSHSAVTIIVSLFTAATSAAGISALVGVIPTPTVAVIMIAVSIAYLALPRLRGHRLPTAPSAALDDAPLPSPSPARPDFAPQRWAVLGGSGFIGQSTVTGLRAAGVEASSIPAPRLQFDPEARAGAQVAANAQEEAGVETLAARIRGMDVVVNAAGLSTPDARATAELYGANALLPSVVLLAARRAGVPRVIHLSSAAVQGRRPVLDESPSAAPFSPYSRSKALGERGLLVLAADPFEEKQTDVVNIRATSVQGPTRATTRSLKRIAQSPLASVSAPGTQPSVVSSVQGLVDFIYEVGSHRGPLPPILLQPWEGLSVAEVLTFAGGREPRILPRWFCLTMVKVGHAVGRVVPEIAGAARRVEMMWFGQDQSSQWDDRGSPSDRSAQVTTTLQGAP